VSEAFIIGDIHVKGNYPFLSKEIRKLITLQPGSVFTPVELEPSADAVKAFVQKHGFYDLQVTVRERPAKRPGKIDLNVEIKKGGTYRVRRIQVEGNTFFPTSRIVNKIAKSSRFRPVRLKSNLKKIRRMYIRKGYVKAQVKLAKVEFDLAERKVDLTIQIKENKRLSLEFLGKQVFSTATIRRLQ
jgi:outer membrane protein insertion porin family